ncbi:MAG: hypothetical protein KAH18_06800 [Psychromonas sp.]|nr:hypothetical protein [Psychromonas sp.]
MPSDTSRSLFSRMTAVTYNMHSISITDPIFEDIGGNTKEMTEQDRKNSMVLLFAGIRCGRGRSPSTLGGRCINQNKESWLNQGRQTVSLKTGNCIDCAAAVAYLVLLHLHPPSYDAKIEILTVENHPFVVVNRRASIELFTRWGDNCFIIDMWYSNQCPKYHVPAAFWADDSSHPIYSVIRINTLSIKLLITINEGGPDDTIVPLIPLVA